MKVYQTEQIFSKVLGVINQTALNNMFQLKLLNNIIDLVKN